MQKFLLSFLLLISLIAAADAQLLYSNNVNDSAGRNYNPELNNNNNAYVAFDDINVPASQVLASDSIAVTKVKFGLYRFPNVPAVTVKVYYSPVNASPANLNDQMITPAVFLDSIVLPANGSNGGNIVASLGDSIHPLFKIKTNINALYPNYHTFFLGISFSDIDNAVWNLAKPAQSFNDRHLWIYNTDTKTDTIASFLNFPGSPSATFNIQVFGYGVGVALPVTFSQFLVNKSGAANHVSWITETEKNSKGFEVQTSADGANFTTISFVPSKAVNGNSTSKISYDFFDATSSNANIYYRLKQIDFDGRVTFAQIVLLKGSIDNKISVFDIYPNPVKSQIKVVLNAPVQQKISIIVTDLSGKILLRQETTAAVGTNNIYVNVGALSAGNYILKAVTSTNETIIKKFIKQ